MVDIDNLIAQPGLVKSGATRQVTFSWDGDVDKLAENPIEIELSIENEADVFFLDENSNLVKKVYWQAPFTTSTNQFIETLYLKCTQAQATVQSALITMKATNSNNKTAETVHTITYK